MGLLRYLRICLGFGDTCVHSLTLHQSCRKFLSLAQADRDRHHQRVTKEAECLWVLHHEARQAGVLVCRQRRSIHGVSVRVFGRSCSLYSRRRLKGCILNEVLSLSSLTVPLKVRHKSFTVGAISQICKLAQLHRPLTVCSSQVAVSGPRNMESGFYCCCSFEKEQ